MLLVGFLLTVPVSGKATDFDGIFYGDNDYGGVGLLQTPTARMRPDGEFGIGISTVRPYNQVHLFVQPLPWLEAVGRYTDVTDRFSQFANGTPGDQQHYTDKSADLKVRLLQEGRWWPSVALGIQDIGGTGLFSSEYLVGNYHWYDFDVSAGLAWGRLGSAGGISNPFGVFGNHFDRNRYDRNLSGQGGSPGFGAWFTGKTIGPFGGVAWNTPVKGLQLRMEYDGNNYEHEGLQNNLRQNLPINFGLGYRGLRGLDLGVGFERGNTVMGRVAIFTDFQSLRGPLKTADPMPMPVQAPASYVGSSAAAPGSASPPAAKQTASPPPTGQSAPPPATPLPAPATPAQQGVFILNLRQALKQQGYTLIAADYDQSDKEVRVWLDQARYRNPAEAIGRAARVLSATAPAEVQSFVIIAVDAGSENYRATVPREDFDKAARGEEDFDKALSSIELSGPGKGFGAAQYIDDTRFPNFSWDMAPAVRQSLGGPNGFYYGQLYWKVAGALSLNDHLSMTAAAGFNIINNFNDITLKSNSVLPHVRSDIALYLQQGSNGIINLESDYIWSPYPDVYHRLSFGIFEEMYGGVATELLFRPYGYKWAVALDVNRVKQRGFDEMFDFLPYMATTGHVNLYYKPGIYNLLFKLSVGQYLARDRGGTLDISRQFDSGVRFGIFATKTNVSAAEFGEGGFDKGFYISLPLDLFFTRSTRREAGFAFRPLTRDGGQMVYDGPELYFTVKDGQPSDFARGAADLLK